MKKFQCESQNKRNITNATYFFWALSTTTHRRVVLRDLPDDLGILLEVGNEVEHPLDQFLLYVVVMFEHCVDIVAGATGRCIKSRRFPQAQTWVLVSCKQPWVFSTRDASD